MKPKILVITPVKHIEGVPQILESAGTVQYMDDPTLEQAIEAISDADAVFTNPNKSNVFIGRELMDAAPQLQVIATASTGTNHIDKTYAAERALPILSLTEERHVIDRISSTAEHAFALTLACLRHVTPGHQSVLAGQWNYEPYIGRQVDHLTIGVVGYGRLGSKYAHYAQAFGARVLVVDPYKEVGAESLEQTDVDTLLGSSDVVALHMHVTPETTNMVDTSWFDRMKRDVLIVNTARGDLINETDLIRFLRATSDARIATDVVADEVKGKASSPLIDFAKSSQQVLITPHIGGMTREGQQIAYSHAASMLKDFLEHSGKRQ